MTTQDIVQEVVKIILKYAKPTRIYLYGSQQSGEAAAGSDIDIAYDDASFRNQGLIDEDIEKIQTLVKIDVKNIAFAEDRFRNRVRSMGRVLPPTAPAPRGLIFTRLRQSARRSLSRSSISQ